MKVEKIMIDFSCVDKFLSADPAITVVSMYEAYVRECSSSSEDLKALVIALNNKMWEWHSRFETALTDDDYAYVIKMISLYNSLWEKTRLLSRRLYRNI